MLDRGPAMTMALAVAACSTLPAGRYPAFEEHRVVADYAFAAGAPHQAAVPASSATVWVHQLSATPAAVGEVFADGQRYLLAPPDCERMQVSCSYRVYAEGGAFASPSTLFPGAMVRELPPTP